MHPLGTVQVVASVASEHLAGGEVDLGTIDVPGCLRVHRQGRDDPTTCSEPGGWWRATLTPVGPATLHVRWTGARSLHEVHAEAWGPGADWMLERVPQLLGALDRPVRFEVGHPAVLDAQRDHPSVRIGGGGGLYHSLLPVVIGQRVTTGEAFRSWRGLCAALGGVAPGPIGARRLLLPPAPGELAARPYWWFHRLGIERKRADALRTVARHADLVHRLDAAGDPVEARRVLQLLSGIGEWTVGSVLGPVFGDPDAVAVGDFWLKHMVCRALAGAPRGDDEQMLALLEPYHGQRGRIVRLLGAAGWRAQRFGPGERVIPIARL